MNNKISEVNPDSRAERQRTLTEPVSPSLQTGKQAPTDRPRAASLLTMVTKKTDTTTAATLTTRPVLPKATHMDASDASIMFAQLYGKLINESITAAERDITMNMKRLQQKNRAIMDKLEKIAEKREKAAKQSLISKIFGWVGNILGLFAGIVATVLTGGAGVAMIVGAVIGITASIMSETGAMEKMVEGLTKAITKWLVSEGVSEGKAKEVAGILSQVIVAVAILAVTITAALASGGAAIKHAASTVKEIIMRNIVRIAGTSTSLAGAGGGTSQILQGVSQHELLKASGEKLKIQGRIQNIKNVINSDTEMIGRLSQSISQLNSKVSNVLHSQLESSAYTVKKLV